MVTVKSQVASDDGRAGIRNRQLEPSESLKSNAEMASQNEDLGEYKFF